MRAHREAIEEVVGLLETPIRVEDPSGKVLFGDAEGGDRHSIEWNGAEVGAVFGGARAGSVARLISHFFEREAEKRALADETLGRYKELTLLYDMSDSLSRVLDVEEVGDLVVRQAHRFLKADAAVLLLHERRRNVLAPVAEVHGEATDDAPELAGDSGLEGRVLETGRAELGADVSDEVGVGSRMCAPLRTGESVFGVLRVTHEQEGRWNAGDLKLLTSIAAQAAAAISHGTLHAEHLRRHALRGRIERFVSAGLVTSVLGAADVEEGTAVAVLYCDVGHVFWSKKAELPADVLKQVHLATSITLKILMAAGACVDVTQGEMLVAVFPHPDGFQASARAAVDAALEIVRSLDPDHGGPAEQSPGLGIARTELRDPAQSDAFLAGVGVAAMYQVAAAGRILVEYDVAEAVRATRECAPAEVLGVAGGEGQAYEVRA